MREVRREQVEKAARECSSTTHTGGKGRFVDRERGSRLDGTGKEDEAAVEVVEMPRPRPKEGGAGVLASVHATAEERRSKTKTGQATMRGGKTKDEVTGAGDITALQRQVEKLTGQVRDLKGHRISTNREIKHQRAWVEAELEERAMAAQDWWNRCNRWTQGIRSELASELAAVREQEQAKGATGERLQETLIEEQIEKRMGGLEGSMSELAAKLERNSKHNDLLSVQSDVVLGHTKLIE